MDLMSIEIGLCQCGCGGKPKIADRTDFKRGYLKGVPYRYLQGHATRPTGEPYIVDSVTGCWNWNFGIHGNGYGVISINFIQQYAHVYMWEKDNGPTPSGKELDHKCKNRKCCNPDHLEPVTHAENTRRGKSPFKWEDVNEIRSTCKTLADRKIFAKKFSVTTHCIGSILRGERWSKP